MYSITFFLVFLLCSAPLIWCKLTRHDIKISSLPIAGGIVPSKSISLSTSTATKFLPSMEERKEQNITLKTPFLSVSVKNTTDGSANGDTITDTLADLVDKFRQDLLLGPEQIINPEDIMLDLDIPVRLTELNDLTDVSSAEQFKQKILQSSLLEKLFENIEGKEKYYSALKMLASGLLAKRTKRELNMANEAGSENKLQKQRHNPTTVVHKIFYHYPKKTDSDFVYRPETSGTKIRRDANSEVFFNPSMRSDVVGVIHHLPHLIPPHIPIRAPILPHRAVHHVPRLPPLPPLPIIPPAVLAQIIRARIRHPLLPVIPIALLPLVPKIARSIGILPTQLLHSLIPYSDEEDIVVARDRENTLLPHSQNMLPIQQIRLHSIPYGYPILQHLISSSPAQPILQQGLPRSSFLYSSRFGGPTFEPVHRRVIDVGDPKSIFSYFPPFRRNNNQNRQTSILQVPNGYFPNRQTVVKNMQHVLPAIRFSETYNRPHTNMISHHSLVPMSVTYTKIPRATQQINNGNRQEVLESFERTGTWLGNTLFSFISHMPTITR